MKQTPFSLEITASSSKEKLMATKRSKDIFCSWKPYFGVIRRKTAFELLREMVEANPGSPSPQLTLMLRLSRDATDFSSKSHILILLLLKCTGGQLILCCHLAKLRCPGVPWNTRLGFAMKECLRCDSHQSLGCAESRLPSIIQSVEGLKCNGWALPTREHFAISPRAPQNPDWQIS